MFRKTILAAVAATAVIGKVASPHPRLRARFRLRPSRLRMGRRRLRPQRMIGASIAASNYYAVEQSCWQYQTFVTPRGNLRRTLVNVCN